MLLIVAEHWVGPALATTTPQASSLSVYAKAGDAPRLPRRRLRWQMLGRGTPAPLTIWVFRIVLVGLIAAAVGTEWMTVTWGTAGVVGAILAVRRRRSHRPCPAVATRAQARRLARRTRLRTRGQRGTGARGETAERRRPQRCSPSAPRGAASEPPRSCSAGPRPCRTRLRPRVLTEPDVFAVSGGSYMAAAMAVRRRFARPDGQPVTPEPWTESYRVGSAELERLRRHTRYLFEPAIRLRDGVVTLLLGAGLNVVVVGIVLLGLTWVSVLLAVVFGVVTPERDPVVVSGSPNTGYSGTGAHHRLACRPGVGGRTMGGAALRGRRRAARRRGDDDRRVA